ncbi:uncharacterized protein EV420DRAFT_1534603 [Desarmillaria tabescens]|uniref:Yeast cell wall synthesis Kre9/Knh1-like N-terminal domain-containing protein n=1 Tax=Armillaria tabescens TaxID=1929756 RepID=A0AA39KFF8_ARMTA|nr:uncharacterized protein EV420DRAFT_1534603 [Desarmillaria tabescens]KAK0460032.1 hypothetical protein EV420DRAFT_1534603 [Desarmillaria tabescens]
MLSLKAAALVLAASATVQGLQLLKPSPGGCHGSKAVLKAGGAANISWIVESGDPESITFQLQNDLTLDSWQVATNVETARGSVQWKVDDDVTQSDMYYLQATHTDDIRDVITTSPLFQVHGEPPSATWTVDGAVNTSVPSSSKGGCKFSASKNHLIGGVSVVLFCGLAFFHIRRFRLRRRQAREQYVALPVTVDSPGKQGY